MSSVLKEFYSFSLELPIFLYQLQQKEGEVLCFYLEKGFCVPSDRNHTPSNFLFIKSIDMFLLYPTEKQFIAKKNTTCCANVSRTICQRNNIKA